jgi:hypothetical protein
VYAGDTVKFRNTFPDYSAADGWTLSYVFRNQDSAADLTAIDVSGAGTEYTVTIPKTATAKWKPGKYKWLAYITKSPERFTIARGDIEVLPDPGSGKAADERTQSERMLELLRGALEASAGNDVVEYTISGRVVRRDRSEVLKMEKEYAWRVARERGTAPTYYGVAFRRPC